MAQFGMLDLLKTIPVAEPAETGLNYCGKELKLNNEDDAKELSLAIQDCESLQFLNLKGNSLGVEASVVIGEALKKKPELKKALFSDLFTGRTKTEIPKALINLSGGMMVAQACLSVLDLSDNAMGPIGAQGVVALLKGKVCEQLQELYLNNNGLGTEGAKMIIASSPTSLNTIVMGRNRLENEGAIALGQFLMGFGPNQGLKVLSIPQNGIYYKGVTALALGLGERHTCLRVLNLNDNTVGPKGAAALSQVFPKMAQLEDVNLGDCLLKTRGALKIVGAICGQNISKLDISYNEVGPTAYEPLAALAKRIPTLSLRLGGNRLGEKSKTELKKIEGVDLGSDAEEDDDDDEEEEEQDEESDSDHDDENSTDSVNETANDSKSNMSLQSSRCEGNVSVNVSLSNGSSNVNGNRSPIKTPGVPSQSPLRSILKKPANSGDNMAPLEGSMAVFLANPSATNFKALGGNLVEAVDRHCQALRSKDLEFVDEYVSVMMCFAGLKETPAVRCLFQELATWSKGAAGRQWGLANAVLTHLGLIKSETSRKMNWDLDGCLQTVAELIEEPFFPPNLRDTIRFFGKVRAESQTKPTDALYAKYPKLHS